MKALLAGGLAAMLLASFTPSNAGAARKRDAKAPGPAARDSVLRIPRVDRVPDLDALLERLQLSERDRTRAGAKTTTGPKPAREPESAPPRGPGPGEAAASSPQQDSLVKPVAELEVLVSSPREGSSVPDPLVPEDAPGAEPPTSAPPPDRPASADAGEPAVPDSSRMRAAPGALAPPGQGPRPVADAAPSPPDDPPTPRTSGPASPPATDPAFRLPTGSPDRARASPALWALVAAAAGLIAWTGIVGMRARARRSAGGATREPAEEAADGPRARLRLRRMFLANCSQVKGRLLLAALFMVVGAAVELLKPWPLKVVLDHAILAKPVEGPLAFLRGLEADPARLLLASAVAIVVISVLSGLCSYLQIYITKAIGYRMVYALRREVFAHLQRLSLSFHTRARSGDLLTTFGKDTSTLRDLFAEALLKFADHSLTMIGMLVVLWFVHWKICLLAVATLPILCLTLVHLYRQTRASLKRQRRQEGRVVSRVNEVLAAVPLVQAFGRERYEEERYEAESNETLRESIRMTRLEAAATRSTYSTSAIGTALVVLFGGLEVLQGRMLPGELVLVLAYLTSMYKPLRHLAKLSLDVSKAAVSADRIGEVLEIEPEIQDRPDAIEADRIRGAIQFVGVSFEYGDGRDVLRDVSFDVSAGQRVALVGVSGAGKSTIASLILRLYEAQRGVILVDGLELARYRRESLRRQIGIVLQESLLFGATIRENIAYGKPDASAEEIVAAARTANADEFIRELADGYDAVVGERGVTLSAGQRQRIAIARTVIRDPRILILDEPMRGLDAESESRVREALDRLMVDRTSIIITHDLASVVDADQVLVLDDGVIVGRGTYDELVRRKGRYRELLELDLAPATAAARP